MTKSCYKLAIAAAVFLCGIWVIPTSAEAKMFGKQEVKYSDIKEFKKWRSVVKKHRSELGKAKSNETWRTALRALKQTKSKRETLDAVNQYVNGKIRYKADKSVWGKSDYWASPLESFRRGKGDCDDYAIAKYFLLRELGFSDRDMRIVVLRDNSKNEIHAVLSVKTGGKFYILDNQFDSVMTDYEITSYEPIYSINQSNWWRHS